MATPEEGTPEFQTPADWHQEPQIDWEKRYKDLQSEFTRRMQEQNSQEQPQDDNSEAWKQRIKSQVLEPELEKFKESVVSEQRFNDFISVNPDLRKHEKAIKEIAQAKWLAYEDVIEEYWFWKIDKLNKAKDRSLVWDRIIDEKQKTVFDLSDTEFEALEKQFKGQWQFSQLESF